MEVDASDPMFDVASLLNEEEDYLLEARRRAAGFLSPTATVLRKKQQDNATTNRMIASEYLASILDMVGPRASESSEDIHVKANSATIVMNTSLNALEEDSLFRHTIAMTVVYCVAYMMVSMVGIIGNFLVISVVYRAPRMRTVTNFFIANLAVADMLVVCICAPATLLSNIFVRKYFTAVPSFLSFEISLCLTPICCASVQLSAHLKRFYF